MPTAGAIISKVAIVVAVFVGVYAVALGVLLTPSLERLYATVPVLCS